MMVRFKNNFNLNEKFPFPKPCLFSHLSVSVKEEQTPWQDSKSNIKEALNFKKQKAFQPNWT